MPAQRPSESTISESTGTTRWNLNAGQLLKKVQVRHWQCHICGRVLSRNSGLKRHMKTHNSDPTNKLPCPWDGCDHRTLHKFNLDTHILLRHSRDRKFICYDDPLNCVLKSTYQRSLDREAERKHNHTSSRDSESSVAPSLGPPFPSPSRASIPSPEFFPFGETSSPSLPLLMQPQPSFHCSPPWNTIPEPQITNGSHGWSQFGPTDPIPSHPPVHQQYQHSSNYAAEFQYSQPAENFSFTGTNDYMPAPTLPTYLPFLPYFNHSDNQSLEQQPGSYQHYGLNQIPYETNHHYRDFGTLQ